MTRTGERRNALRPFLRRTSFDELPQFINVLGGESRSSDPVPSAGIRPAFRQQIPGYMQKHLVSGHHGVGLNDLRGDSDLGNGYNRSTRQPAPWFDRASDAHAFGRYPEG
jgi:putative colanic acid biosynthesis UDP-glucose lipid carrier transferase